MMVSMICMSLLNVKHKFPFMVKNQDQKLHDKFDMNEVQAMILVLSQMIS